MKDLVIGAVTNLSWDQCKYWVNSLNQSGFSGDKIICMFGSQPDLISKFKDNGFEVYVADSLQPHQHICSSRFYFYYSILNESHRQYNNVIATDVSDVVFQKNPSDYFDPDQYPALFASSENIKYIDEPWGANNVRLAFGDLAYLNVRHNIINNAGVIAGSHIYIKDLFFAISIMCDGRQQYVPGGGAPDQAAYNLMLTQKAYSEITNFVGHDQGWACQVGTTADPHKPFGQLNIEPNPIMDNGIVKTSDGVEYYIVHQYNRNPQWKQVIENKFK